MATKLDIMLLYDIGCEPDNRPGHERWFMTGDIFRDERHVMKALRRKGHRVEPFGLFDRLDPLLDRVTKHRPDVVFNMCEAFSSQRRHEADVMSVLEMLGVPHTGASAESLSMCKDKALSKKIVSFHGVPIPKFTVVKPEFKNHGLDAMRWPAICKPLDRDSSEGISASSVVRDANSCVKMIERLSLIHI